MNDFLHKLRNNANTAEKRFLKNRRQQPDRAFYDHKDRRNSNERRAEDRHSDKYKKNFQNPSKRQSTRSDEQNESIIRLLNEIASHQSQLVDIGERRANAEEQKAQALKEIVECLNRFMSTSVFPGIMPQASPTPSTANETVEVADEEVRRKVIRIIMDMRQQDSTYGEIAEQLEKESFPTFSGKGKWHAQTVHRIYRQNHTNH